MKFSTRMFSHNGEGKYFSAEASDLGPDWVGFVGTNRYPISNLTLVSDFNCEATFEPHRVETDGEGEIQSWIYYPSRETLSRIPRLQGYHITVFND